MNNKKQIFGDPVWEDFFSKSGWGKYPPEEVVRFYFRIKNKFTNPKILDIGCGQGACSWFMAKEGGHVSAFDGAPSGLKNIGKIANGFGVNKNIELIHGDITKPSGYINKKFDIMLDNYSLCCNPEKNIMEALYSYYSLLKPKGYFLMNCFGDKTTGYGSGTMLAKNTYTDLEGSLKERGLITWFNKKRLRILFNQIGFNIVYFEYINMNYNNSIIQKLITCLKKI